MDEKKGTAPEMTFRKALFGFLIPLAIVLSIVLTGNDVFIALFLAMTVLIVYGLAIGFKFDFLLQAILDGASSIMGAVLIMLMVGMLVAVWMLCGSVPSMLYYGLKIINPQFFLPISFIICIITSTATGSSWGTAGTMGVALMGVAAGMGLPLPLAAGCIISGAHVGDKLSPLSDTTLLASASTGTKLFDHIASMLYTTVPGSILCLIIYTIMGWQYGKTGLQLDEINILTEGIASTFHINPLMLIPPVLVIVLSIKRMPAHAVFGIGIIFSAVWAVIFQGVGLNEIFSALINGYTANTSVESLNSLLSRGGTISMASTIYVTIFSGMFAGLLKHMQILSTLMMRIRKIVRTPAGLVTTVTVACSALMIGGGGQYTTLTLPGVAFKESFDEMDVHSCVLSRTLEDTGTLIGSIIPWDVSAIFFATTLGVGTLEYLPFAILPLASPIIAILNAWTGFGMFRLNDRIRYAPFFRRKNAAQ